jgi:hypothetical protein
MLGEVRWLDDLEQREHLTTTAVCDDDDDDDDDYMSPHDTATIYYPVTIINIITEVIPPGRQSFVASVQESRLFFHLIGNPHP